MYRQIISVVKENTPWPVKIVAKLILSRLPVSYQFWERLHLFKYGDMDQPEHALSLFRAHFERAPLARKPSGGFVVLELGPGDSLFSALIAKAFGASTTYLVDKGSYAREDLKSYREMAALLRETTGSAIDLNGCRTLQDVLGRCSAHYLTDGVASLRSLPEGSVDFIWSHHVLEHVRRGEFVPLLRELRRVQQGTGSSCHSIDLQDHLSAALNNLRFREGVWESDFMAKSGFYTNRLRYSELLQIFQQAGFEVEVLSVDRWPTLPTAREKLAPPFRDLPEEELAVSKFSVLLR